jgi:hypothetical protein
VIPARQQRLEYLLLVFLLALFIFRGFIPAWRSLNTDFRNYYVAAWLIRNRSSMLRVYDFSWFQRQKDHAGLGQCIVGFVPDTLLSALPIVPFAKLSPLAAKRCWLIVNAILLGLSLPLLTCISQLGWRRVAILTFLAVEPLATCFHYGQMHLLVFFLLVMAVWCSEHKKGVVSGFCIALAAGLKLYPALFVVFFIRKRQWQVLASTCAGLILLAGASIYLFGWDVHSIYVREILPAIGRGENIDPYAAQWNSLTALLHRALIFEPGLNPHPLVNLPSLYAVIQPLCQALIFVPAVWLLTPGDVPTTRSRLEWATFIAMLIALSTAPTPYHLCALILTAILAIDSLMASGQQREACALAILYGLSCYPWPRQISNYAGGWHMLFASPRLYPMLALAFFLYAVMLRNLSVRERIATHRREALAFVAALSVLAIAGSLQAVRHQSGMFDHYRNRLFNLPGVLLLGEPAVSASGIYFTQMPGGPPKFATWHQIRDQFSPALNAEDEFHPAATPLLPDVWVEAVGPVSNIVRISHHAGSSSEEVEVIDGEEPAVSPDAKLLAFIREKSGRGGLWVKNITSDTLPPTNAEREVVPVRFDVWEAAFAPDGRRIVFTAAPDGQPTLMVVDTDSRWIDPLPIAGPARYPAYSPSGILLAYSQFANGAWHVYVWNSRTNQTRRVVQGDCNSISPAWEANSKELIYASDCGRGLEMTALERIEVSP